MHDALYFIVSDDVERTLWTSDGTASGTVAVDELVARRSRLESFGDKARFALADSYDRATQAQARGETP